MTGTRGSGRADGDADMDDALRPAGGGTDGDGVAVEVAGGTISVRGRTVWRDLDVQILAGEFVAVLGPNGVGKSTLLRVVLGLQALDHGSVRVLGRAPDEARPLIGYLPQRRTFDASVRVRGIDVVRLGVDGTHWGLPLRHATRAATRRKVDAAIRQVGADTYSQRPIGELSGGEQQRLLIAQALVRDPRLLLLDEPLDSLDLPNQAMVARLVADLCHERGITVVLVAHDVNPILQHLDRVVYLGAGGAASGPPAEVINGETLSALYGTSIEVLRASDGRLVVVGQPEAPAHHHDRHHP